MKILFAVFAVLLSACQTAGPVMNPRASAPITSFDRGTGVGPAAGTAVPPPPRDCDGVPHGGSVTGYASATVPKGQACVPIKVFCNNGMLSGGPLSPGCHVLPE